MKELTHQQPKSKKKKDQKYIDPVRTLAHLSPCNGLIELDSDVQQWFS